MCDFEMTVARNTMHASRLFEWIRKEQNEQKEDKGTVEQRENKMKNRGKKGSEAKHTAGRSDITRKEDNSRRKWECQR